MASPEISLLVIRSKDIHGSAAFYEQLGFSFTREKHGSGPEHYAAKIGMMVFEIYPLGDKPPTIGARLGFLIEDLDEVVAGLDELAVVRQPQEGDFGYSAVVRDPDEHMIELTKRDSY